MVFVHQSTPCSEINVQRKGRSCLLWAVLILLLIASPHLKAQSAADTVSTAGVEFTTEPAKDSVAAAHPDSAGSVSTTVKAAGDQLPASSEPLWSVFIAGAIGGFLAFFMPCIYPMVPLTISFFTKRAETKGKGVQGAFLYGLSIVVIYVVLGLLITLIFGSGALNELSTNGWFNLVIFLVLFVFGISFLGAFEINLPTSLANKLDAKSDSKGLGGIFFMAATLAVVSFSCTGPVIGTVLVAVSKQGQFLGPIVGMLGFSGVLALIFTVFAIFPGLMSGLPKSGGWLNAVKVVLGFIELALSLKFLSNADLAFSWKFLDREVFLCIWIVISAMIGLYLLGKLKLPHDSDLPHVPVGRVLLAILAFAFTMYLIPGLWGAPLKVISGLSPSMGTQDFVIGESTGSGAAPSAGQDRKYSELFHRFTPYGIAAFYDYDEGMAYAKSVHKPALLDFTGEQCVNCRKMEQDVWSDARVKNMLKNDYVLISLFTDSKKELPAGEVYHSDILKTDINSVGKKFKQLEAARFNTNSQPFYVLVNNEGEVLAPPQGANFDVQNYIDFLESGLAAFKSKP